MHRYIPPHSSTFSWLSVWAQGKLSFVTFAFKLKEVRQLFRSSEVWIQFPRRCWK